MLTVIMVCCGATNIVSVWLRFLHISEYTERFLDNGYDDLETVKQMGEDDLKAIGVDSQEDEEMILLSVKILREQGAAWVYFLLGEDEGAASSSSGKMSISDEDGPSSSSNSYFLDKSKFADKEGWQHKSINEYGQLFF